MGRHQPPRRRILPQTLPEHLPRRPVRRGGGPRVDAQEPFPQPRTQPLHVRRHRADGRVRHLHRVAGVLLQAAREASVKHDVGLALGGN